MLAVNEPSRDVQEASDMIRLIKGARARVTYTRKDQEEGFEEHYAWGQPIFTDGRIDEKEQR